MNNKSDFIIGNIVLVLFLTSFLSGCSIPQDNSSLSDKESRMSEELIRSQVLRYKADVEKQQAEIARLSQKCPEYNESFGIPNQPVTSDMIMTIETNCPELWRAMTKWSDDWMNYNLFYNKLKDKGADMNGLEIEDFNTTPDIYSPPIEESKKITKG